LLPAELLQRRTHFALSPCHGFTGVGRTGVRIVDIALALPTVFPPEVF